MQENSIFVNNSCRACENSVIRNETPMRFLLPLAFSVVLAGSVALADDGAASIAAGGLVMGHESHITIARQVLRVSPSRVTEDYDFRNNSDVDITTEVAFVIPD